MRTVYVAPFLLLGLAGCASALPPTTPAIVTTPPVAPSTPTAVETLITRACASAKVQAFMPKVCTNPALYAADVVLAGKILETISVIVGL